MVKRPKHSRCARFGRGKWVPAEGVAEDGAKPPPRKAGGRFRDSWSEGSASCRGFPRLNTIEKRIEWQSIHTYKGGIRGKLPAAYAYGFPLPRRLFLVSAKLPAVISPLCGSVHLTTPPSHSILIPAYIQCAQFNTEVIMMKNTGPRRGKHGRVKAGATLILPIDPHYVTLYNEQSIAANNDLAIAECTRALNLDPDDALAYVNRGLAYYDKGDHDRALTEYTETLKIATE